MVLFHPSYSMFVASAEERREASHENWAPNYHHPPSDVDVAGTALHVDVAGTELFIHMQANITDGYNYQQLSCSPNLRVSKNRLCCPSPFLDTTPNCWTTWRSLSPTTGDWHTAAQAKCCSGHGAHPPPKQDRHVSNHHHHFKGECAYLAFLNSKGKS